MCDPCLPNNKISKKKIIENCKLYVHCTGVIFNCPKFDLVTLLFDSLAAAQAGLNPKVDTIGY